MPKTIACGCGNSYDVSDGATGASAKCIWCGRWNPIPAGGAPPATRASTPPPPAPPRPTTPLPPPAQRTDLADEEVFPARRLVQGVLGCLLIPTVALAIGVAWGFARKHETEEAWAFGAILGIVSLALLRELLRASGSLRVSAQGIEEHTPISTKRHAWPEIGAIVYTERMQHGGHGTMAVEWKCRLEGHDGRALQTFRSTYDRPAFASIVRRAEGLGYARADQPPPLLEIRLKAPPRSSHPGGSEDRE